MDILENWGSKYALTILAAKRAKQIKDGAPVLIRTQSKNPLTIALEEIAQGKVTCEIAETDLVLPESIEPDVSSLLSIPVDTSLVEEHAEEHEEEVVGAGLLDEEEIEPAEELEEDVGETLEEELAGAGIHEEDELALGGIHDEDEHLTIGAFHDDEDIDHPVVAPDLGDTEAEDELEETLAPADVLGDEGPEDSMGIDLIPPKRSRGRSKSKSSKSDDDADIDMGGMLEDIEPMEPEEDFE
ncbi:MAG: DNA-directed RNA polymerase subunit omega [Armatimonadota bacterium]|nr:DNA-directed RNA polymerase subunit omega [Armatimonadota bacterium]